MIRIVPLELDHIKKLSDPSVMPGLGKIVGDIGLYWENIIATGTAYAGFLDQKLLGCGGYASPWPGVAEVWFWETPEVHANPVATHNLIRRGLKYMEQEKGMNRISCEVLVGNARAERWVKLLGFKHEGTMRKRGPNGSDFELYAKVRE